MNLINEFEYLSTLHSGEIIDILVSIYEQHTGSQRFTHCMQKPDKFRIICDKSPTEIVVSLVGGMLGNRPVRYIKITLSRSYFKQLTRTAIQPHLNKDIDTILLKSLIRNKKLEKLT